MKLKEITVSADLKLTRNYQSAGAQVSITASLEEGENLEEAHQILSEQVQEMVETEVSKSLSTLNGF